MVPAISFAYENAELDIMDRTPRKAKLDHLVNAKLISFAYFQIGVVQASAGTYTYFYCLNDFGIRPSTVWYLALKKGPVPNPWDIYDASQSTVVTYPNGTQSLYGNSKFAVPQTIVDARGNEIENPELIMLAWDKVRHAKIDIRLFYSYKDEGETTQPIRGPDAWTVCRWDPADKSIGRIYRESIVSDGWPICYSTEALKFAQAGYLVSIVCVQWADLMICKTRNLSISQQGMTNTMGNFGLVFETVLVAILLYVPFLNFALGTRQIPFHHFLVPSFSFFCAITFYDELRKLWLRQGMVREEGKLKLKGWIVQNTYY